MFKDISFSDILSLGDVVYIDTRSENEFDEGTIPGAVNFPLFDNQQRREIGIIYNEASPKDAYVRGLEIASQKLPYLYRQIEQIACDRPIVVFCWRGGMRSKALAAVLDLMHLPAFRLSGGYKAYRNSVTDYLTGNFPFHVVVVRGNTGVGKTCLLQRLKNEGYPVIDLEGLSNNRGSVFGHIGLGSQPSQKQFEALLYSECLRYQDFPYLVFECESKRIGRLILPNSMYNAMQEGTQVLLHDTLPNRIERLVQEYTHIPNVLQEMTIALERLKKRIGKRSVEEFIVLLHDYNYQELTKRLILEYYDNLYGYPNTDSAEFSYCISYESEEDDFRCFKTYLDNHFSLNDNYR